MKKILVNYNFTPGTDFVGDDYLIYDRSDNRDFLKDFDQSKIIVTENIGQVDRDKLSYLIDNYYDLPDVFLWGKTNLFKYITKEEYDVLKNNKTFTPLLTQGHRTYSDSKGVVCYYQDGMYYERNDSWYVNQFEWSSCKNYSEFAYMFALPNPSYLPFAPGGNYILTRETVHKYGVDFYKQMRDVLNYCREPSEAQMAERSYFNLWR